MNEIINKFLLTGDKFMPEMHLRFLVLVDHLLKMNREFKDSWRLEIQNTFTNMSKSRPVFKMVWLMEILNTEKEEHNQIKS